MKSIRGIYHDGQVTLEKPIVSTGLVEIVVVYDEKEILSDNDRTQLTFQNYTVSLANSGQHFTRDELY